MKTNDYQLVIEPTFKADYKQLKHSHPELISDLNHTIRQLALTGTVESHYHPHLLTNRGGLYTGNYEFHLTDGTVDVLVIYKPHRTNPTIRLIRVGSHHNLFT